MDYDLNNWVSARSYGWRSGVVLSDSHHRVRMVVFYPCELRGLRICANLVEYVTDRKSWMGLLGVLCESRGRMSCGKRVSDIVCLSVFSVILNVCLCGDFV